MPRVYVAGWIKRGPIRVIGTNGRMRWPACARCSGTPPLTPCSKRSPQTLPRCRARFLLEKRFRSSRSGTGDTSMRWKSRPGTSLAGRGRKLTSWQELLAAAKSLRAEDRVPSIRFDTHNPLQN